MRQQCATPGCGTTEGLHEHHVIPRAYGGLNGPTVIICGACHTLIHDASLKSRDDVREQMLKSHTEQGKAYLRELIHIIRKSRIASKRFARPMVFQNTFSPELASKIRELKQMLGVSSIQRVVEVCIERTYDQCTPLRK